MKKLFLSHKEEHPHLRDFEDLLREVLRVEPVLLERQPRKGMDPRALTEYYMKQCDGVLFLLTKDLVKGSSWHPSTSVSIELEIARSLFPPEKRFYLREEGVQFPSMADATTYVTFSWENILPALIRVTKDLREASLIEDRATELLKAQLSEEEFFLLEQAAQSSSQQVPAGDLSDKYTQKFQRDLAAFNILVSRLEQRGLLAQETRPTRLPDGGLRGVRTIKVLPRGLEAVGLARQQKAAMMTETLKKLGLIQKGK